MTEEQRPITKRERTALSTLRLLWQSINRVTGLVSTVLGVGLALVLALAVDVKIPLWFAVTCVFFLVLLICALFDALAEAVTIARTPRVIKVTYFGPSLPSYGECHGLFVIEAPDGVPQGATVAFSYWRERLLVPIGYGQAQKQQDESSFHVTLDTIYPDVPLGDLRDRNKTPLEMFVAEFSFSQVMAGRAVAAVRKGEIASRPNPSARDSDSERFDEPGNRSHARILSPPRRREERDLLRSGLARSGW